MKYKTALCPQCSTALEKVKNPAGSYMNNEQFDAVKAGDWFCKLCRSNGRNKINKVCYWWDKEVDYAINEGVYVLVKVSGGIRVAQVTAEDTQKPDSACVLFPGGHCNVLHNTEMEILETTEKIDDALHYLFGCVEKDVQRSEKVFGLLKGICREIRERDLVAPDFFRDHDRRPTTDEEMAENILKYMKRFAPVK
jgi:hypothetical protein